MRRDILLNIDIAKAPGFNREFSVKNGDSLFLNVQMFQHSRPLLLDNQRIRVYVRKSDGSLLMQGDDIDIISENEFQVKLKNSATNVSGLCYMEIEFQDNEEASVVSATSAILFEVEDRIGDVKDAILAVDELYLVGEIEKFIIQAKIDMALLKEQIAEGLVKIGEFNEFVIEKTEELQSAIDKALDDITANSEAYLSKITGLSEEYGLKIQRLSDEFLLSISLKADEVIETIRNERENSISIIKDTTSKESLYIRQIADSKKSEIERKANEKIAEIEIKTTEVVEAIDTKTEESIDIINTAKVDAINKIQEVEAGADIKIESLNNLITVSEEILATFDTSKSEASEIRDALTALIETCNSLKANLEAENNKATSNINELNTLHPESNTRIETLRALIEEAKQYEVVVRDFIASQTGSVDLTEVYEALETLNRHIEDINNRFNNYYTKEEVDNLISNIDIPEVDMSNIYTKEEVDKSIDGLNERINLLDGTTYKTVGVNPVPPEVLSWVDNEGMFDRIKLHEGKMNKSAIVEFKMDRSAYSMNIASSGASGCVDIRINRNNSGDYIKDILDMYTWNGSSWNKTSFSSTMSTLNIRVSTSKAFMENIYESTLEAESSLGKLELKQIDREIYNDFNICIKELMYKINDDGTALNSPGITTGILTVEKASDYIKQQAFGETDVLYRLYMGGEWTEWKTLGDTDTPKIGTLTADTTTVTENVETDFNKAHKCSMYNVRQVTNTIANSPMTGAMYGVLKVSNVKALIHQTLETTEGRTFKRMLNGNWTAWKEDVKKNEIENLLTSVPNKINTFTYTNADGMPEIYKWFDINGLKIMWIDVKLSESEYNSGSSGAMMKTLNFPAEAQIFNSIIMANITSYNRSGNDTLSRVVQNAEIISNVSVRGRWRHTDNTYPRIDRFTIMCLGI